MNYQYQYCISSSAETFNFAHDISASFHLQTLLFPTAFGHLCSVACSLSVGITPLLVFHILLFPLFDCSLGDVHSSRYIKMIINKERYKGCDEMSFYMSSVK